MRGGVSLTGTVPASDAGDVVEIDQLGSNSRPGSPSRTPTLEPNGSFTATWHPARPGQLTVRAAIKGAQASSAAGAAPTLVADAIPPFDRDAVRPRLLRTPDRLRTDPQARHDRGGQPDAPLRHAGPDLLQGQRDHGAGDRPRPVRARSQLGPDDGDRACARNPRDRGRRRRAGPGGQLDHDPHRPRARPRRPRRSSGVQLTKLGPGVGGSLPPSPGCVGDDPNPARLGRESRLLRGVDQRGGVVPVLAEHREPDAHGQRRACARTPPAAPP